MLARDFIDDSLYNPNYGYFPKQAVIFDPDAVVDAQKLRDVMQETAGPATSITAGGSAQMHSSVEQAEKQAKAVGRRRRQGFDFASMRNMSDWDRTVAETYGLLEDADEKTSGLGRQVWHTPTELFKVGDLPSLDCGAKLTAPRKKPLTAVLRTSGRTPSCNRV